MANTVRQRSRAKIRSMPTIRFYVAEKERPTVKAFKKLCALREISMSAAVLAFMRQEIAAAEAGR
jgi:hypothetical protein